MPEMSKTRPPSVGDTFTQTRTILIVRHSGRSEGDDRQKRPIFEGGVQNTGKSGWTKMGQNAIWGSGVQQNIRRFNLSRSACDLGEPWHSFLFVVFLVGFLLSKISLTSACKERGMGGHVSIFGSVSRLVFHT